MHPTTTVKIADLIDSPEACQILDIDRSTLSRWVQLGKLQPAFRLGGEAGRMVFLRPDVEAFKAAS